MVYKIHALLNNTRPGNRAGTVLNIAIMMLITINVVAVILETCRDVYTEYRVFFEYLEYISVGLFSIEYLLRVYSCTGDERYKRPVIGRLRYIISPMALVDLFAILPFYAPMVITLDLRFIRILRFVRIVRLFKLTRYSEALKTLGGVFIAKKEELVITLMSVAVLLIISASIMYFVENDVQPEAFSSIPATMWWSIATLTTVGYGDVYPITPLGKILGAIIAILGVGLFALPAGILSSGFAEMIRKKEETTIQCRYCHKEITKL
jgi:voltage-gated potassium channel